MSRITLGNGLIVRVRAFRRETGQIVIADAVRNADTRTYDREYQDSIKRFEEAWRSGQRGEDLLLPSTGAEVFMMDLRCERVASRYPDDVTVDSRRIGGSGTEWRVRWDIDGHFPSRFRVGDTSTNYVLVSAVKMPLHGRTPVVRAKRRIANR